MEHNAWTRGFTDEITDQSVTNTEFTMTPLLVPHRDELSDMHAFILRGENQSILYLLTMTLGKRRRRCTMPITFVNGSKI